MANNPNQNPSHGQYDPKKGQQGQQQENKKNPQSRDDENQRDQNRDKKQSGNY